MENICSTQVSVILRQPITQYAGRINFVSCAEVPEAVKQDKRKIFNQGNREFKLERKRELPRMVKKSHKITAIQQS